MRHGNYIVYVGVVQGCISTFDLLDCSGRRLLSPLPPRAATSPPSTARRLLPPLPPRAATSPPSTLLPIHWAPPPPPWPNPPRAATSLPIHRAPLPPVPRRNPPTFSTPSSKSAAAASSKFEAASAVVP
uniref:Uncharacterized protein n=1 Tax=Oryza sativa subsp. japonica TaxID=39947 RepID=Q6ZB88_ORYSJ|nr:unknown protein [Oryza sativa Japonica Group]